MLEGVTFPSWRWMLLFALIAFMLTVIIILTMDQGRTELVAVGVLAVAACVYFLSRTHALLPLEHQTICDITGDKGGRHYLAYITDTEKTTLQDIHKGRDTPAPGINGTQGVPCFPTLSSKRKHDTDEDEEKTEKIEKKSSDEDVFPDTREMTRKRRHRTEPPHSFDVWQRSLSWATKNRLEKRRKADAARIKARQRAARPYVIQRNRSNVDPAMNLPHRPNPQDSDSDSDSDSEGNGVSDGEE